MDHVFCTDELIGLSGSPAITGAVLRRRAEDPRSQKEKAAGYAAAFKDRAAPTGVGYSGPGVP